MFEKVIQFFIAKIYLWLTSKGRVDDTIKFLEYALKLRLSKEYLAGIHFLISFIHMILENYEQAITECDKALVICPNNEIAYLGFGRIEFAMGDYKKAIEFYDMALEFNKDPESLYCIYFEKARALSKLKDNEGAIENFYNAIKSKNPESEGYFYLINELVRKGNDKEDEDEKILIAKEIIKVCDEWISKFRFRKEKEYIFGIHYERGSAKRVLGDNKGALKDFNICEKIMKKYPNNHQPSLALSDHSIYEYRGHIKYETGNYKEAYKYFKEAISLGCDSIGEEELNWVKRKMVGNNKKLSIFDFFKNF